MAATAGVRLDFIVKMDGLHAINVHMDHFLMVSEGD